MRFKRKSVIYTLSFIILWLANCYKSHFPEQPDDIEIYDDIAQEDSFRLDRCFDDNYFDFTEEDEVTYIDTIKDDLSSTDSIPEVTYDTVCNNIELSFDFNDGSLQGWVYHGRSGYVAENRQGVVYVHGDSFSEPYGEAGGIEKVIDINPGSLYISFKGRARSDTDLSTVTNLHLMVKTEDESLVLYEECIICGGTYDSGWFMYREDLSEYVRGVRRVKIILCLRDAWIANWNQENYYDDIIIRSYCE